MKMTEIPVNKMDNIINSNNLRTSLICQLCNTVFEDRSVLDEHITICTNKLQSDVDIFMYNNNHNNINYNEEASNESKVPPCSWAADKITDHSIHNHKNLCLERLRKIRSKRRFNYVKNRRKANSLRHYKRANIFCIHNGCLKVFLNCRQMIKHVGREHISRYNTITIQFTDELKFETWIQNLNANQNMTAQHCKSVTDNLYISYYICDFAQDAKEACQGKLLVCKRFSQIMVKYVPHFHNDVELAKVDISCVVTNENQFVSFNGHGPNTNFLRPNCFKDRFGTAIHNGSVRANEIIKNGYCSEKHDAKFTEMLILKESVIKQVRKLERVINDTDMDYKELLHLEILMRKLIFFFESNSRSISENYSPCIPTTNVDPDITTSTLNKIFETGFNKPAASNMYSENGCFTEPITDVNKINKIVTMRGPYSVSLLHLKSLDYHISSIECVLLRSVASDFRRGWLYDAIIDAFLYVICKTSPNTIFLETAITQVICNNTLTSIKMQAGNKSMAEIETIFVPCNPTGKHWILLVIKPKLKQLQKYDPTCKTVSASHTVMKFVKSVILILLNDFGSGNSWDIVSPPHVLQTGDYDCGVYISWYSERILNNYDTESSFNPMKYRKYMYDTIVK